MEKVNRLGTPRSTSSSQRSLSRTIATLRPSRDSRNAPYAPGSPSAPNGFPVRSSQVNWGLGEASSLVHQQTISRHSGPHAAADSNGGHRIRHRTRFSLELQPGGVKLLGDQSRLAKP